jgi:periplasmic divalent cation tolerance protein
MSELSLVLVTAPDPDTAARLARTLVEERLAACGNLVPGVRSIYRWNDQVCDEAEVLLILKTRQASVESLRARIVELHPYACPEVVALSPEAVHPPYLAWVLDQVD